MGEKICTRNGRFTMIGYVRVLNICWRGCSRPPQSVLVWSFSILPFQKPRRKVSYCNGSL